MRTLLLAAATSVVLLVQGVGSATLHKREFRILDLNISGSADLDGRSGVIADYLADWAIAHRANVITLQEVCATQHNAILGALRQTNPAWTGTWKSFGPMEGCAYGRHGLSIMTIGSHSGLQWWRFDSDTFNGNRWWGMMRVRYAGLDIFNTHVRCARRNEHLPQVIWTVEQSPLFLLAGDFNTPPDEAWGQYMHTLWYDSDFDDMEHTIVARRCLGDSDEQERLKIDYIWTNRLPAETWADAVNSPSNHRLLRGVVEHWFLD